MLLPFGVLFFLIENMNKAEKNTKFFKIDFNIEVFLMVTNKLIEVMLKVSIIGFYLSYVLIPYFDYQFFNMADILPTSLQLILCLMFYDFFSYWRHRAMHKFLWPIHAIHHSAEEVTWITRHRFHPFEHIISVFFEVTVLFFIGVDPEIIIVGAVLISFIFYLSHANIKLKYFPYLRFILISPHYHRWHHSDNKEAYGKNYAGVFPFLDMLFGTYYHPEELPKAYGLNKKERTEYSNTFIGTIIYPVLWLHKRYSKK